MKSSPVSSARWGSAYPVSNSFDGAPPQSATLMSPVSGLPSKSSRFFSPTWLDLTLTGIFAGRNDDLQSVLRRGFASSIQVSIVFDIARIDFASRAECDREHCPLCLSRLGSKRIRKRFVTASHSVESPLRGQIHLQKMLVTVASLGDQLKDIHRTMLN